MVYRFIVVMLLVFISFVKANNSLEIMKAEKRTALVVGNNNYQRPWATLRNPINDAKAIKEILEDRGFDVIYETNITKREFMASLENFYQKIKGGGVGLFYFAGHGIEVDNKNYLIPIDAVCKSKSDVEFEAIALDRVTKNMQEINNRLNIVILDACRNNPFIRGGEGGLAKIEPRGLFISYATEAGKVADDGGGEHGLFTENLIKYMKEPLNLHKVFKKTRTAVRNASSERQFPAIYDQTDGEFFFTLPDINGIDDNESDNNESDNNPIITKIRSFFQMIIDFFISDTNSKSLNIFFILMAILGFGAIIFTTLTSFLYSERTNYILKAIAILFFFLGIGGYIMSYHLHLSDRVSFLGSLAISFVIFITLLFSIPKPKEPKGEIKVNSLIDSRAILLDDIKIADTGHATITTNSSRYRKLVRNKSDENLSKGDEVIVMSDEAIPIVSKK